MFLPSNQSRIITFKNYYYYYYYYYYYIRVLCPLIATYVANTYRVPARLFVVGGSELKSAEGTTQGHSLAMSRESQWGGGFYGYRLEFWLFYGYRLFFFSCG